MFLFSRSPIFPKNRPVSGYFTLSFSPYHSANDAWRVYHLGFYIQADSAKTEHRSPRRKCALDKTWTQGCRRILSVMDLEEIRWLLMLRVHCISLCRPRFRPVTSQFQPARLDISSCTWCLFRRQGQPCKLV